MEEIDTKEKILRGASDLFMRYGVRSISMDDIARQLSISKKTLYQHFADKDELVLLVATAILEEKRKHYDAIQAISKNSIEELARISMHMKSDLESINPSLLYDLQKFHPKAWAKWIAHKNEHMCDSIVQNLTKGIEAGYFRPEINPEILAAIRIELIQIGFNTEAFPLNRFNLSEIQEQLFDHFVYGLLTDKGRKLYEKYKSNNPQPLSTPAI
jgi:TetR/AcrR family transcriptional regulator, cholesterol catabolism regulator